MDMEKLKKIWDVLESQKCIDCIFTNHCDDLSCNYKLDFCGTIQRIIENEGE